MRFIPQLDFLRAVAVILVIISHWFGDHHFLNRYTPNGPIGVTLFFVLSGYLITGILLRYKEKNVGGISLKNIYKVFYARRALRIFPVYYLFLIVILVFKLRPFDDSFVWHFAYLSNVYIWLNNNWIGNLSHLWSLSVEEQFYLFWPAIILLIPRQKLTPTFLLLIFFSILFVFIFNSCFSRNNLTHVLTPSCLDSFCLGALFAYGQLYNSKWFQKFKQNETKLFLFSLLLFVAVLTNRYLKVLPLFVNTLAFYPLISLFFAQLILYIPRFNKNAIINNKALLYLGKISYGLYLFHNIIPKIDVIPIIELDNFYAIQLYKFIILVAIASTSWFLFEKPILKLKDKFVVK